MQFAKTRYIQNFMAPFSGWVVAASRLDRASTRRQFTFYQIFLVLTRSILERWKAEMTLKPSSGFELMYQPSYYQIQIRVTNQTDSIMTLNCELFQSEFSVLSGSLSKMFPLHISRPNDYTIEIVLLQIEFCNIFTNVLSNIFKRFH